MIGLSDPRTEPSSDAILASNGGFAWWYVDLVDEQGNGVVLIWSWGLPFLPAWMSRVRSSEPAAPGDRPSLNIVTYAQGTPNFYLLQEYPPSACRWHDDGRFQFGDSTIATTTHGDQRRMTAELDCPVPGTSDRLQGTLTLEGPIVSEHLTQQDPSPHRWTPICTAVTGEMNLRCGALQLVSGRARAYHDRNASPHDLETLGIDHWIWGRVPYGEGERIYYLLWPSDGGEPRAIGLTIGADGVATRTETLTVELLSRSRGWFGMPWWRRVRLTEDGEPWAVIQHRPPMDDGPFYLRFHTEVETDLGRAIGVGEAVRPSRIDLARHRPLVRMAVHTIDGPNSFWLPLFSGPRATRWSRLLRLGRTQPRAVEAVP